MGAIHGVRHTGFIGDTYLKYPFPPSQEDFRQNPKSSNTQAEFRQMIEKYAVKKTIPFRTDNGSGEISIGDFVFDLPGFGELIEYVIVGGMPRYRDEIKPGYVTEMIEKIRNSPSLFFREFKI